MKSIRQRVQIYGGLAGIGLVVIILLLINTVVQGYPVPGELMLVCAAALIAAGLYVRECSRLRAALLIVENQILHFLRYRSNLVACPGASGSEAGSPKECPAWFSKQNNRPGVF